MSIPFKSNRLAVAELIVDNCFGAFPESPDAVRAYADLHGLPLTSVEAADVLECLRHVLALAAKGVIVDEGCWCGVLCEHLIQTRGLRVVMELEAIRSLGGTHVMRSDGDGMPVTIDVAIGWYRDLEDNAFGLAPVDLDGHGLTECDVEGRRILRGSRIMGAVTLQESGVIIWDDGDEWCGNWAGEDGLPCRGGVYRRDGVVAMVVSPVSLDRALQERALALAGEAGFVPRVAQAFRINDEAYLFTFCGCL